MTEAKEKDENVKANTSGQFFAGWLLLQSGAFLLWLVGSLAAPGLAAGFLILAVGLAILGVGFGAFGLFVPEPTEVNANAAAQLTE